MVQPVPVPLAPAEPGLDIARTRVALRARPQLAACAADLTRRFEGLGLVCETQTRQTPRGLSTYVAVVGQRGLLYIVDITLIDGPGFADASGSALEFRLLDGCGDVAAVARAGTTAYLLALALFGEPGNALGSGLSRQTTVRAPRS